MKKPIVSVVITTKNEEKNIGNCLDSIRKQSYPSIEIIVVDNGSKDRTKEIAREYTKLVFNKGPERSAQRNFGVGKSSGKWILYLDADMMLTPDVVSECVGLSKNYAGLYIPERIVGSGFWIKVRDFERSFYDGTVIDAVRFVSREVFDRVGGFDLKLTGPEDWDFDKKVRQLGNVKVIKSGLLHNEGRFDMKEYLAAKKYYSKTFDAYVEKWGNDSDIRKQLGWYRLAGVFVRKPFKMAFSPLLTMGMYWLRVRVGVEWVRG